MVQLQMLGFLSTSFFFVTMVVASGTVQFSMRADLLLNLIHRKIQDDSEGNFISEDKIPAQEIIRMRSDHPLN